MRKVNILGIHITDCTLRESLAKMNLFLQNNGMNTVLYVNTALLLAAGQSENLRNWVETTDMTVCGDLGLLISYGITSVTRIRETQNFTFLRETLKKLAHTGNTAYLVADSADALERLTADVKATEPELHICGSGIFEESDDINDTTLNDINKKVPTVVLLRTSYGFARRFMAEDADRINAGVVIAFPREMHFASGKEPVSDRLSNRAYQMLFRRRLVQYEKRKDMKNSQK